MVAILMMSAKLDTLGFLKVKVFWNKYYDAISYADDVNNKILLRDSNYIVDWVMWLKFGSVLERLKLKIGQISELIPAFLEVNAM